MVLEEVALHMLAREGSEEVTPQLGPCGENELPLWEGLSRPRAGKHTGLLAAEALPWASGPCSMRCEDPAASEERPTCH